LKSAARKYLEFGVLCALAVGILWWFGRKLDWAEVREALGHTNKSLLAVAVVLVCASYLLRAYRWGALLAPLGPARIKHLFAATTIGFGAVFLIGRMGEVVRPVMLPLKEPRVRASASFVTIMVERIYDMLAVVILFAVNLLWFVPPSNVASQLSRVRFVGVVLLVAVLSGVAVLVWFRWKSATAVSWVSRWLTRWTFIPQRLTRAIVSMMEQLARALRVLANARELAVTIAWTALIWGGILIANLLVLRAFGLNFGVTEAIFVLGWSLVGSLVPTPGGAAGAFHAATAAGLIFLGVERETAAAISIVMHVIDFGPSVIFGFFYFVRGDINFARLRSLSSPEAVEHAVKDESITPETNGLALEGEAASK
jgi:glycosyltransferase 2 family protein